MTPLAAVTELRVLACLSCAKVEQTRQQFVWHSQRGHLVEELRLKRRTRTPGQYQWSTDWARVK